VANNQRNKEEQKRRNTRWYRRNMKAQKKDKETEKN
jgi:hypothetical protein